MGDYVLRAIVNWEKANGVPFPEGKEPHHKNEIKTDDRPENIQPVTRSEHIKIHIAKRPRDKFGRWIGASGAWSDRFKEDIAMGNIIEYKHHGKLVKVDENLKGKHREHCLCFRCRLFAPGQGHNCGVAELLYQFCKEYSVTTPVFECPWIKEGTPDLSAMG